MKNFNFEEEELELKIALEEEKYPKLIKERNVAHTLRLEKGLKSIQEFINELEEIKKNLQNQGEVYLKFDLIDSYDYGIDEFVEVVIASPETEDEYEERLESIAYGLFLKEQQERRTLREKKEAEAKLRDKEFKAYLELKKKFENNNC